MKNMKKMIVMLLALITVMSLAGCGKTGLASASLDNDSDSESSSKDDDKEEKESKKSDVEVYENEDGTYTYEGRIGSTMETEWFDFTVNDAYYTSDSIGGYTPSEGNVLVVVDMTIKNNFTQSIDMYTYDFQLQWNDDSEDAYAFPIETSEPLIDNQFENEFSIKVNKEVNGCYIFEAPEGNEDFSISFLEFFEDETEGDLFFVYFSADEK